MAARRPERTSQIRCHVRDWAQDALRRVRTCRPTNYNAPSFPLSCPVSCSALVTKSQGPAGLVMNLQSRVQISCLLLCVCVDIVSCSQCTAKSASTAIQTQARTRRNACQLVNHNYPSWRKPGLVTPPSPSSQSAPQSTTCLLSQRIPPCGGRLWCPADSVGPEGNQYPW